MQRMLPPKTSGVQPTATAQCCGANITRHNGFSQTTSAAVHRRRWSTAISSCRSTSGVASGRHQSSAAAETNGAADEWCRDQGCVREGDRCSETWRRQEGPPLLDEIRQQRLQGQCMTVGYLDRDLENKVLSAQVTKLQFQYSAILTAESERLVFWDRLLNDFKACVWKVNFDLLTLKLGKLFLKVHKMAYLGQFRGCQGRVWAISDIVKGHILVWRSS